MTDVRRGDNGRSSATQAAIHVQAFQAEDAVKALSDSYKVTNAPEVRTEHEHRRDLIPR